MFSYLKFHRAGVAFHPDEINRTSWGKRGRHSSIITLHSNTPVSRNPYPITSHNSPLTSHNSPLLYLTPLLAKNPSYPLNHTTKLLLLPIVPMPISVSNFIIR